MRKSFSTLSVIFGVVVALVCATATVGVSGASAAPTPGVTASTIQLGIAYPDLAAVKQEVGITIVQGNWIDAYKALIANINKQGGVAGRKIVPQFVAVNPIGTAPSAQACTQLTEDDHVFAAVVFSTTDALCYIQMHHTAVINGVLTAPPPAGSAPNFQLKPSPGTLDPQTIEAFAKTGTFRGRTVGVIAGTADQEELSMDALPTLKKLGIKVAQTAIDDAAPGDQEASNQQQGVIAQKFKAAGVNLVVAVGSGVGSWLIGNEDNLSTYNPPVVATGYFDATSVVDNATEDNPTYLKGLVTATPLLPYATVWHTPSLEACVKTIKKAYPSDAIATPLPTSSTNGTYQAPIVACQVVAFLEAALKAAGKKLTIKPPSPRPGSLSRNILHTRHGQRLFRARARDGHHTPIYIDRYINTSTKLMDTASKPATT